MPQEDDETAELQHAEEIGFMMFPAADQSAEVVEPSEEALNFPAAAVTAQFTAVLGAFPAAIVLVRRGAGCGIFAGDAGRADRCRRRGPRSCAVVWLA